MVHEEASGGRNPAISRINNICEMVGMVANNYTIEQIIESIKGTGGIIQAIARNLGCQWHTAEKYVNMYEETKEAYRDEKESILDLAESKIIGSINSGNTQDAKWYLATQGKKRGYTEKQEIEHSGNADKPLQIIVNGVKPIER